MLFTYRCQIAKNRIECQAVSRTLTILSSSIALLSVLVCSTLAHAEVSASDIHSAQRSAMFLAQAGKPSDAEAELLRALQLAKENGANELIWRSLFGIGWFYDEIGRHDDSVRYLNEALAISSGLDKGLQARTLAFLAWAYKSTGRYELALAFYQQAIARAAAKSSMSEVQAWGLSTQEIGATYLQMGRVKEAKEKVEAAIALARRAQVDMGISECAVLLSKIALLEGDLSTAELLAKEAVERADASHAKGYVSILGEADAKVQQARVALARAELSAVKRNQAIDLAEAAIAYSSKRGISRAEAEAKLVLSKAIDPNKVKESLELAEEAVVLLEGSKSEHRGLANAELGRAYRNDQQLELADFYLKHGLEIDKQLFSKINRAYLSTELAALDGLQGDLQTRLLNLKRASEQAQASNNLVQALKAEEQLSSELSKLGYSALVVEWTDRALNTASKLLENADSTEAKKALLSRKYALSKRKAENLFAIVPSKKKLH